MRLLQLLFSFFMQIANGSDLIPIAIIDNGFDDKAMAEAGVVLCDIKPYDATTNTYEVNVPDMGTSAVWNMHGTQMAIIASKEAKGMACIVPIKALVKNHQTILNIIKSLSYVLATKVKILSLSYEGPDFDLKEHALMKAVAKKGVTIFVAAGNYNKNLDKLCDVYPACYPNIPNKVIVGALGVNGRKLPTSNYGKTVDRMMLGEYGSFRGTSPATAGMAGRKAYELGSK